MSHLISLVVFYASVVVFATLLIAWIERAKLIAKWKEQRNLYRNAAYKFLGMGKTR